MQPISCIYSEVSDVQVKIFTQNTSPSKVNRTPTQKAVGTYAINSTTNLLIPPWLSCKSQITVKTVKGKTQHEEIQIKEKRDRVPPPFPFP